MAKLKNETILLFENEEVEKVLRKVNTTSKEVRKIVRIQVKKLCNELDLLVTDIRERSGNVGELSNEDLEYFIIHLSGLIYITSENVEMACIQADVSKAIKTERYNRIHLYTSGTIPDKENSAQEGTIKETLVSLICERVYKIGKQKLENAQELQSALKKIVNIRGIER